MSRKESPKEVEKEAAKLLAELSLVDIIKPSPVNNGIIDHKLKKEEAALYKKVQTAFNNNKKSVKTQEVFDTVYGEVENPYELALKFHVQGVNYSNCKSSSFTFYVIEAFNCYAKKHPDKHKLLQESLKTTAFGLTNKDPNSSIFKLVSEAYRFKESSALFEGHVRDLMKDHKYVAAARFAQHCGVVHEDFIIGFLLPISFDRHQISTLYEYLEVATDLQNPFMQLLDSMLTKDADEKIQLMMRLYKYKNVPPENLNYDYLKKNVPKLQKRFNTPPSVIPNSSYQQTIGAITFWVLRFATREVSPTSFHNKIQALVPRDNADLQLVLLSQLLRHSLELQALHWILQFNIDILKLPAYIQTKLDFAIRHHRRENYHQNNHSNNHNQQQQQPQQSHHTHQQQQQQLTSITHHQQQPQPSTSSMNRVSSYTQCNFNFSDLH